MIIRKYGIELHRLTHEDIELVRTMRNQPHVRNRMFAQNYISREHQEVWFQSINNQYNYFFIIHHQGEKIGLIQGKNHDFDKREHEGGIYIWEQNHIGGVVASKASICFMEASFLILNPDKVYAQVRPDNQAAINYNLALGYAPCLEKGENFMVLERDVYERKIPRLRFLAAEGKHEPPLSISDIKIADPQKDFHLYQNLPAETLKVLEPLLKK